MVILIPQLFITPITVESNFDICMFTTVIKLCSCMIKLTQRREEKPGNKISLKALIELKYTLYKIFLLYYVTSDINNIIT